MTADVQRTRHPFTVAGMTWRSIMRGRRPLLVGLLAVAVLLIALLIRQAHPHQGITAAVTDRLCLNLVVPLAALLLGVNGLGNEMEDGSITYVLATPTRRWQIVAEKLLVIGAMSAAFGALLIGAMWLVVGGRWDDLGFWMWAGGISGAVHATLFAALGAWVRHSVITGLLYIVIWEQVIMGLAQRARFLSLHHASLTLAYRAVEPYTDPTRLLGVGAAATLVGVVVALSVVVAVRGLNRARLSRGD